jgi:hypothetical protein
MASKIPAGTDCNVIAQADGNGAVAALGDAIGGAALACMDLGRSPSALGYRTCPAPCNAIGLGGCTAGNGSPTCTTDRDCDTVPGAADGRCGDWAQAAACLSCVAESAVTNAIQDKYGTPSVALPDDAQQCQHAIGAYGLVYLMRARIIEALSCQKKLDTGKTTLASGVSACKDSDPKAKIAAAQAKAASAVLERCSTVPLGSLDGICSGALTLPEIGQCVIDNAKDLTEAFAFAVVPSSARRCGDDLRTGFEECDGTDDDACPGVCTSACSCATPLPTPVMEDLTPCAAPAVIDRYRFPVLGGESVHISADTTNPATAADLCFIGNCAGGSVFNADNEVPCAHPVPGGAGCPTVTLTALADGFCTVEMTECNGLCSDLSIAEYVLNVTRDANPTPVFLVADDEAP